MRHLPFETAEETIRPVVQTATGTLRGYFRDSVSVFKGVPYAADTGGRNRFRPPRPVNWPGIREAVHYGPTAPQLHPGTVGVPNHLAWIFDAEPRSEDCLVLNIYAPREPLNGPLPVMVFFHGGGFMNGSASPPGLDGTNLAKQGVVVVTINHRLNILGHLYLGGHHRDYQDSGNVGLLDALSALHWIQTNICQFGGDPRCVTIFGQSGGGSKVAALMAMPEATGLFHRAIIQSASSMLRFATLEEAEENTHNVLKALQLGKRQVEKLHDLPIEVLLAAVPAAIRACGQRDHFRPVIDGHTLPGQPFARGIQTCSDVPVLLGWCETEQRAALSLTPKIFEISHAECLQKVSHFLDVPEDKAATVLDTYAAERPDDSPGDLLAMVYGDHRYRRTVTTAADVLSVSATSPAYVYLLKWRSPAMEGLLRAPHMLCLPFVFRNVESARLFVGTAPDLSRLQEEMSGSWVAFAKTGNPSTPGFGSWPEYDPTNRPTMVFDQVSRVTRDPASAERLILEKLAPYKPAEGEGGRRG
ncbi:MULTISPECIES: carboxylesterase family protein [unclassified Arthrobacter]|uniref:carboxylesterase/lipase family protein n=1 Tax=unclassified Arthrobacter TaxID=235627 RepID=UPI00288307A9|nr:MULTISPECIES: carboxylesterase family protein [unclassified Arthrobacter]